MRFTTFYTRWASMKQRCLDPKCKSFPDYGGRGISVCEEWLRFENFKNDMLAHYSEGLTLDRIDNDSHYCKENCRWVTRLVQNNNTRRNDYIEFNGVIKTLSQWAASLGMKRNKLSQRLYAYGWSIEKSLLTI